VDNKRLLELAGVEQKETKDGFNVDIETDTIENKNFRKVLFTTKKTQLVLMSLLPGEDIGEETHNGDQFFRFEKGEGKIVINGKETKVKDGSASVVPEGALHNVINTSETERLQLYAIYSPPQHEDGTIDKNKSEEI
jgi:mannose-6-phosphate isomerase-like protein (cupin superfamily)